MRTGPLRVVGLVLAVMLSSVLAGGAFAYFSSSGVGSASAAVKTLSAPTISAATPGGGTVALTWGAVTAPGPGTVTYSVKRDGGEVGGNCPSTAEPESVVTCTDSGVAIGNHTYTVTARWRSWSATSSAFAAKVTFGEATDLALTAASTTPGAGVADNLTITALDEVGNTVTTYASSHSLIFSGASKSPGGTAPTVVNASGTAVAFGSATAITFTKGVATVASSKNGVMKLYAAGAASVTVSDGSISDETPLALTVAPGAATKLSLAAATTTPTAGVADNLTTTALDAYGNTATSYTGSHNLTFSGASSSPSATLPTVADSSGAAINFGSATAITFTNGIATVSSSKNGSMKLYKAETAAIGVSDGSISTAATVVVTVAATTATKLAFTNVAISDGELSAPCLFTCKATDLGNSGTFVANVSVTDAYGNTVSAVGTGHTVSVTATGGTLTGGSLTIASTGAAESTTLFTYTSKSAGTFADKITAAKSAGTTYTSAVAETSR